MKIKIHCERLDWMQNELETMCNELCKCWQWQQIKTIDDWRIATPATEQQQPGQKDKYTGGLGNIGKGQCRGKAHKQFGKFHIN